MIVQTNALCPGHVYLDHQASTPIDPRVKTAMDRSDALFCNPHTNSHIGGIMAGRAVKRARRQLADAIGGDLRGIVFTSGATEANNIALLGVARASRSKRKIVTISTEHSSVLEPCLSLRDEGIQVSVLPVGKNGLVDLDSIEHALDDHTLILSIMHVNNETGVIQPISDIASVCHNRGVLLHSDCAQSLGRIRVDVSDLGADILTFSSHKCYGPKGIGALYIGSERTVPIKPLTLGGGQEGGLRPGTLPVPLCVGFGEAARIAAEESETDGPRLRQHATRLLDTIRGTYNKVKLTGSESHRVPGAFNVCFPGASGEELLNAFNGIYVSSGSACASDGREPSRVLLAHGLTEEEADASLRFCVGRFTTEEHILKACEIIEHGLSRVGLA